MLAHHSILRYATLEATLQHNVLISKCMISIKFEGNLLYTCVDCVEQFGIHVSKVIGAHTVCGTHWLEICLHSLYNKALAIKSASAGHVQKTWLVLLNEEIQRVYFLHFSCFGTAHAQS